MSLVRLLVQRVFLGVVAAWSLLSLVFVLFTGTEDWVLGRQIALYRHGNPNFDVNEIDRIRQEYLAQRGLDRPFHELYIDWMGNMVTLQWGESFETGDAVFPAVMDATITTGTYVVPATALALLVGLAVGVYTALWRGSPHAEAIRTGSYFGLGFPHFWIGIVVLGVAGLPTAFYGLNDMLVPVELQFFYGTVVPALLLALALSAAIVSYARAYSLQYATADLTKLVRAKGGGSLAVARHVVRNAAIPLVSLVFTETFALLALSVFVIEALFGIDGIGQLIYNAVWTRDLPMLLGATLVVVSIGVLSNILQDVAYSTLDPRVDTGTR